MESPLVTKSKSYAHEVLSNLPDAYTYHNLGHTTSVAVAAEEVGRACGLSNKELEVVVVAAWLHDTGYQQGATNHEENSAKAAIKLLEGWDAPQPMIKSVTGAIKATTMPQNPKNLLDQVLCDADLYHLADENLIDQMEGLRLELARFKNLNFDSREDWIRFNIKFLKEHTYFTPFGQSFLEEGKRKNIKKLKRMLKPDNDKKYVKDMEKELDKLRSKLEKKSNPERGIETMFKIASQNHTNLSSLADTKANIMISINSIILSVVITVLFRKLEEFPNLLIPTLMLVSACLLTIVFAVLATRPTVSSGKFTRQDIKEKKTNLLFFGNFYGMEFPTYEAGMREMMKDADYLYGSLIRDIYVNGTVLARKYKLLRISYSVFMFGFVSSIIGFTIALLIYYYPADHL